MWKLDPCVCLLVFLLCKGVLFLSDIRNYSVIGVTDILLSKRTKPLLDDLDMRLCICGHLKPRPRQAEHVRHRWRLLCELHGVLHPPNHCETISAERVSSLLRAFIHVGEKIWASTAKIFQDGLISLPPEIPAQHLCRCAQTSIEGQLCRLTPGLVSLKSSDIWLLFNCHLNLPFWPGCCIILQIWTLLISRLQFPTIREIIIEHETWITVKREGKKRPCVASLPDSRAFSNKCAMMVWWRSAVHF